MVAVRATRLVAAAAQARTRHELNSSGAPHGDDFPSTTARPRGRARLRRAGLQRQQPGADPGHHAGRAEDRQPGHPAGLGRRAQVRRRALPAQDGRGRRRDVPRHPDRDAPGPRRQPLGVHAVDPLRLHQRDDGRLAARGRQDAGELRLQRRRDAPRGRDGACGGRVGGGRARLPGLARVRPGRRGRRRRRRGHADARPDADRPRPGRRLRGEDRRRRAGHRHRHQPRRLQVQPQADRRHPRHRPHQGRSTRASRTRTW